MRACPKGWDRNQPMRSDGSPIIQVMTGAAMYRRAIPDDGPAIADVHARSWPWTYDGLLPAEVIAGVVDDREARAGRLRDAIADESAGQRVWVATRDDTVVGFATWSPSQDEDATKRTADVGAIYLDPVVVGQGIGRRLLEHVVGELIGSGFTDATLWVLRTNSRARRFYEGVGWLPDGAAKVVELPGGVLDEVRYRRQRKLSGQ
jgi:GNAT superfamily N-acetyltransferase